MTTFFDSKEVNPDTPESKVAVELTVEGDRPATEQEKEIISLEMEQKSLERRLYEIQERLKELVQGN